MRHDDDWGDLRKGGEPPRPILPDEPPDDQWVVLIPRQLRPPHDMSFVGFTLEDVLRRLRHRLGAGTVSTTRTQGLLRWQPATTTNRRTP